MSMKRRMHNLNQHGFTLVELVMVIVMIGILAAMAVPSWSVGDTTVHAQAGQISHDIRHTQMLAMTQGRTLTFQSTGGGYRCVDSTNAVITDPATQRPFNFALDDGVTLSSGNISFDSLGRPVSGGAPLASATSFTASGDYQTAALSVAQITGFVTVTP